MWKQDDSIYLGLGELWCSAQNRLLPGAADVPELPQPTLQRKCGKMTLTESTQQAQLCVPACSITNKCFQARSHSLLGCWGHQAERFYYTCFSFDVMCSAILASFCLPLILWVLVYCSAACSHREVTKFIVKNYFLYKNGIHFYIADGIAFYFATVTSKLV